MTEETEYRRLIALLPIEFWAEYQLTGDQRESNLVVYQFQRRARPDPAALSPREPSLTDEWGLLLLSPLDTCVR